MDEVIMTAARKLLHIGEKEPIIVLKSPSFHGCPLAGDQGVTNCPLTIVKQYGRCTWTT
jgi:hypothetical protein